MMILLILSTIVLIAATLAKIVNSVVDEVSDNCTAYLGIIGLELIVIWIGAALLNGLNRWNHGIGEVLGEMLYLVAVPLVLLFVIYHFFGGLVALIITGIVKVLSWVFKIVGKILSGIERLLFSLYELLIVKIPEDSPAWEKAHVVFRIIQKSIEKITWLPIITAAVLILTNLPEVISYYDLHNSVFIIVVLDFIYVSAVIIVIPLLLAILFCHSVKESVYWELFFENPFENIPDDILVDDPEDELNEAMRLFGFEDLENVNRAILKEKRNELMRVYHPDQGTTESNMEMAQKINTAYEVLSREIS